MPRIAVVTDSNSGISAEEGKRLGIEILPMPVHIDGEVYYEGVNLSREEFYRRQAEDAEIVTSQPAPADVMGLWDRVLKDHDALVYIPMTAGLSNSCATAQMLAGEYGGRVQVADNRRISVPQRCSVMNALELVRAGLSAREVRETLERQKDDSSIYITVDTLKYLRRGGRVSGVEAMAGTMLNIKPVMEIRGEKLNAVAKVRGMKAARRLMLERIRADLEGRLKPLRDSGRLALSLAYSQVPDETLESWREEILAAFPDDRFVEGDPLTLSIACHTGPGALAIGAMRV